MNGDLYEVKNHIKLCKGTEIQYIIGDQHDQSKPKKRKNVNEPKSSASKRTKVTLLGETRGVYTLSEVCPDNRMWWIFLKLDAIANYFPTVHEEKGKCRKSNFKPKYGIYVVSEEAKVIKPTPKRSKQDLQTELTKCEKINHRLHLENFRYWKVAEAVFGIFKQMGQEITGRINVSAWYVHSSYLKTVVGGWWILGDLIKPLLKVVS